MEEHSHSSGVARTPVHAAFAAALAPVVDALVAARVSANAVTGISLFAGLISGLMFLLGDFGWATLGLLVACVGDALDGLIARRTRTASAAGALFDASADRYQEFFALGGLALFFRERALVLALSLFALMGSFMVSYGSAKAEAARVPVPPSVMRRPERAACMWLGAALSGAAQVGAVPLRLPVWAQYCPLIVAIGLVAIVANVSAIRRLRAVGIAARTPPSRRASLRFVAAPRETIGGQPSSRI